MACFVQVLGWIVLTFLGTKIVYNLSHFFYTIYLAQLLGHNLNLRNYGPWAVVTGATDGLGKAYAKQFGAMGLNVLLVSRTPSRLHQVANEIRQENRSIQVRTVAVDFTEGQSIYSKLQKELSQISIGILVNNVGMKLATSCVADVPSGHQFNEIINCNVMSMARLTNLVLPSMRKRKTGLIINIGSIAGTGFAPQRATYGATKAFVDKFSCDLAAECRKDGVIVQSIVPGYVATKLPGLSGQVSLDVPTAKVYVESAVQTIGVETRTAAYWAHKIVLYWAETLYFFMPGLIQRLTMEFVGRKSMMTSTTGQK